MITDKDRVFYNGFIAHVRSYHEHDIYHVPIFNIEEDEILKILGQRDERIRTESADQARKEAAERVAYAWREHGEDITLRTLRDAVLSTVNESFTVAPVSTDAEKLAIAVKALEEVSIILAKTDGDYNALCTIRQALKEIQG